MKNKLKGPYLRDVYLSYLIRGANFTSGGNFPIIEPWMVASEPPTSIIQWDQKSKVRSKSKTTLCFYSRDETFTAVLNNPERYIETIKKYESLIGPDPSPFGNMPPVVQNSQIFLNLAISFFWGKNKIKIIPNYRLGTKETREAIEAFPRGTLIAIGTNGFMKNPKTRKAHQEETKCMVDHLRPAGIIVYGPALPMIFEYPKSLGIPVYQYDSFMMERNRLTRKKNSGPKTVFEINSFLKEQIDDYIVSNSIELYEDPERNVEILSSYFVNEIIRGEIQQLPRLAKCINTLANEKDEFEELLALTILSRIAETEKIQKLLPLLTGKALETANRFPTINF